MYFHAVVSLATPQIISFANESEDYILRNLVIPFINGQVIESNNDNGSSEKKQILVNMKSAATISIYKTEDKVDADAFMQATYSGKNKEYDCTSEFVEKVRELQANPAIKSILEMAFGQQEKQAFVVMKFGEEILDSAYEGVINPLVKEFDLAVVRIDEIQDSGKINDQILENIAKSCLIISDLSGERPNCYYETGFAHALGKNIILTIHKDSEIHFDLSGHRFIQWGTEKELRDQLRHRLNTIFPNKN